jgi:acyl-CoA dehydrogenase
MPTYQAPVKDTLFVLNDVLGFERYSNLPGFADSSGDMLEAILGEAARVAEEVYQPTNRQGDLEGCHRNADGSVTTPKSFKAAFDAYREGGWMGLAMPGEYGGQGLPYTVHQAAGEYFCSANMALTMYSGLTHGAIAAILVHGTDEQKSTFIAQDDRGYMDRHHEPDRTALRHRSWTDAHQGGSRWRGRLQDFRSEDFHLGRRARYVGKYRPSRAGARIEGSPEGIKGVSLFIVPKFILDENGNPGKRNGVSCGSIEEKMGIHGNSTCVMNYDEAEGYLLGERMAA